ncbi:La-related protein [Ooceraea biroi]|nr:La-related protein [Ooceraea biroi]
MELEVHEELKDKSRSLSFSPPPMKKSETRDSISSVDSDVSFSFDRRGSKSKETGLSDYDNEGKFVNKINADQDSGADSMDDTRLKELETKKSEVLLEISTAKKTIDNLMTLNDELIDKICTQVEFYFSDENIIKNAFLLKHVKRNKEGYVSLKLISSFKKVKHLSRDWRVIGTALAKSKKLEVNAQGTKLRRVDPLPPFDQTAPSRTILATNLPVEKLTIESVAGIFKPCGEIALIRVLRPGQPTPSEVTCFFL